MALVKDAMVRNVISIECKDTVMKTALLMKDKGVSSVIVTRSRRPIGIITEKDFVRRVVCEGRDPSRTSAEDVMSTPLITVNPLMTLEEAAEVLRQSSIKKLGVVSSDHLEGIITATDILNAETKELKVLQRYFDVILKKKD